MTVSKLASQSIVTNKRNVRTERITKFTPHYMVAAWTGKRCAEYFCEVDRQVSANYCIGINGDIVCNVPEEYRAWTSSSAWNDQRAITVECGNLPGGVFTDATWNALVKLGADVCRRYGFRPNYTGDRYGSLTEHRMFSSTDCPGAWLHPRMKELEAAIIRELDGVKPEPPKPVEVPKKGPDEEVGMPAHQGAVTRLYNPYNGDHVYTTSSSENSSLIKAGYLSEGVMGVAPDGLVDVYRLYNMNTGEHMLTDSYEEVTALLKQGKNYSDGTKNGWQFEGTAFIARNDPDGPNKVHRLFNPYTTGPSHILTTSETEVKSLVAGGWRDEGIVYSLD